MTTVGVSFVGYATDRRAKCRQAVVRLSTMASTCFFYQRNFFRYYLPVDTISCVDAVPHNKINNQQEKED
jgi:hypothetical protein